MDDHNNKATAITVVERQPVAQVSPLIQAILSQSGKFDLDTIGRMMDYEERSYKVQAQRQYTAAMVALKRDLPAVIAHDSVVDYDSSKGRVYYTHSSMAGVMDAIQEPLTRHGFSLGFVPSNAGNQVTVVCRLTHEGGHSEEASLTAAADTGSGRSPTQGIASTITYLRRYLALSLLGIATADMKDPTPPAPDSSKVDMEKNQAAVGWLKKVGRSQHSAEEYLGRPWQEWTADDLDALRTWGKQAPQ